MKITAGLWADGPGFESSLARSSAVPLWESCPSLLGWLPQLCPPCGTILRISANTPQAQSRSPSGSSLKYAPLPNTSTHRLPELHINDFGEEFQNNEKINDFREQFLRKHWTSGKICSLGEQGVIRNNWKPLDTVQAWGRIGFTSQSLAVNENLVGLLWNWSK